MKRIIIIFVLCVFFAGCTASGEPEIPATQPLPESQSAPETKAPDEESKPAEQSELPEPQETFDFDEIVRISDELIEEMQTFFSAFLKAYIEGDEEMFKTYMSDELYGEYLEHLDIEANQLPNEYLVNEGFIMLDQIVAAPWGLVFYNVNHPAVHYPGITFFTRLMRQGDIDDNYDLGGKYLVNISYDDNNRFTINWFGIEQ